MNSELIFIKFLITMLSTEEKRVKKDIICEIAA